MDKERLAKRLLELPDEIADAEYKVHEVAQRKAGAENKLKDREAQATLNEVDGKNAEQRQSQLRNLTQDERKEYQKVENELYEAKIERDKVVNIFKALQSVARLVEDDG